VSFRALHNYGLGLRKPRFGAVVKIARALGLTCEAFTDCEDLVEEGKRPRKVATRPPPNRPRGRSRNGK
jgi:hypothetical protein